MKRSFATTDPSSPEYEAASGTLLATHAEGLLKDLDRLNDVMAIARNVLTIGETAQKLAAASHAEKQVFQLIATSVRFTGHGYEKWQMVVNACAFRANRASRRPRPC